MKVGEVLFNNTNSQTLVGKSTVFNLNGDKIYFCSNHITRIGVKDNILPEYLSIVFNIYQRIGIFYSICTNWNNQSGINIELLQKLKVPLLSIEDQSKIINTYNKLLSKKAQSDLTAQQILRNITPHVCSSLNFSLPEVENRNVFITRISSVENRLDPHFYLPSFKVLIDNIQSIRYAQLVDIVEFSNETWNQKDSFENEFPYIEISEIDLTNGKIQNLSYIAVNEAPSRAKMVVRTNDIIVSTTRPHRGAIAIINEEQNGFIASTGFAVLRKLLREDINREYLFYILRTQICLQQMLQRSSGGSYPAITTEELKKIYIPVPTLEVQQQIVSDIKVFIEKAEKLKVQAKANLEKAKQEIEKVILS